LEIDEDFILHSKRFGAATITFNKVKLTMAVFEVIGQIFAEIILEGVFVRIPIKIYEWITGREIKLDGYRTEYKKFIKFSVARKFLLTWEKDIEHLKDKLTDGLEAMNEKLTINDFTFTILDDKTIIQPPASISFYSFHFLVQFLPEYKITTLGIVETIRTIYTTYNDPNSEHLIGQTATGKKFFISLTDDYSKRQFLRINRNIETIEDFDVAKIKRDIAV
jgi:hypothetical protein